MNKPCITCQSKPIKNGYYKAELLHNFIKFIPQTNKEFHNKTNQKIKMEKLEPNTEIFYFATHYRDFTKSIQMRALAYKKLENSGIAKVNLKGEATIYIDCPQIYRNDDGEVYHRHLHFVYWDKKNNIWGNNLYTQKVICNVDEDFVKKNIKKAIIIDALPTDHYEEKHIKGAYSLPFNKRWSEKDVEKIVGKNKLKPIIVYCWDKKCNAAEKVCKKLNKLGYYNVVHYLNGISEWSGLVEGNNLLT